MATFFAALLACDENRADHWGHGRCCTQYRGRGEDAFDRNEISSTYTDNNVVFCATKGCIARYSYLFICPGKILEENVHPPISRNLKHGLIIGPP